MATKAEILAILRRGTSGLSDEDLDTLAGQLSSAGATVGGQDSTPATEAELKARKDLLESMGEMNRARKLEQNFIEAQIAIKKAEILEIKSHTAATQAATDAARQNTEASEENAEATQNETEAVQGATKSAEELEKELRKLQKRQAALTIEAKQTSGAFEFLGGVVSNTTKEFAEIGKTGVTVAGVFKSLKGLTKDQHGAMMNLVSSDIVQGFAQQADALNILTSELQKAFEMASKLDTMNANLFKSTGIAEVGGRKLSFQLADLADETSTLSRTGEEAKNALIALQDAQKGIDFARDRDMVKQIALLEQAGVSAQLSADIFVLFQKSGLPMAKEAETINLKLYAIAKDLGQAPEQVASAFKNGMSTISAYGDRGITVFSRMLGMSEKLSMSVEDTINKMGQLDDIDEASRIAQAINAILELSGGDVLQGFELAAMEEPERLQRLQEVLTTDQAQRMIGQDAGRAGRLRIKELEKVGIFTAEEIRKVMKTPAEDLSDAADDISKTAAMSLDELQGNIRAGMKVSERAAKDNEKLYGSLSETAQATREVVGEGMSGLTGKILLGALGTGLSLGLPLVLGKMGGAGGAAAGAAMGAGAGTAASLAKGAARTAAADAAGYKTVNLMAGTEVDLGDATMSKILGALSGLGGGDGDLPGGGLPGGGGGGGGAGGLLSSTVGKAGAIGALVTGVGMTGKDFLDAATAEGEAKKEDLYGGTAGLIGGAIGGALGAFAGPFGVALGAGLGSAAGNLIGNAMGRSADAAQARPQSTVLQDFTVTDFKTSIGADMSDEIVGVKEGGLIARKLDRLISIMSGNGAQGTAGAQEIVVQIDGNEVGRAAVKSINNDFYNMRN